MKIYLLHQGKRHPLIVEGSREKARLDKPVCECGETAVVGTGLQYSSDRRNYEAEGCCLGCKKHLGRIIAEPNTLFGAYEDDAVLCGRCRVY